MTTLAEIRAKLAEQDNKQSKQSTNDNAIYPFWNIPEGTTATLRFLPDADQSNTFFWVERQMIKLPFAGIKGQEAKPTLVQVPCNEMWGEPCPVLAEVRPWFKDPSLEDMGRKYWKKRSYIFQGFVVNSPLDEDTTPENPIRRFVINPSIYNIIRSALMNPEMEDLPTDLTKGREFKLTKTQKGGYADYSTSSWSFKERALSDSELSAMKEHGLHNLSDYLPKKPSQDELNAISELFKASVDGELYDPDRFGQYYRPAGLQVSGSGGSNATTTTARTTPAASQSAPAVETAPVVETAPAKEPEVVVQPTPEPAMATASAATTTASSEPASNNADDILAMIRARQKK
tara:strand:- start:552 stop:1589 length:1038 start_codon:yes stop_codon:yes gene_type:complete